MQCSGPFLGNRSSSGGLHAFKFKPFLDRGPLSSIQNPSNLQYQKKRDVAAMKGLLELTRNYLDLNVIEKSKVGDVATHCDQTKSGSCTLVLPGCTLVQPRCTLVQQPACTLVQHQVLLSIATARVHPTQLGHPDCRLLVRKRTGAPRHTAMLTVLASVLLGFS